MIVAILRCAEGALQPANGYPSCDDGRLASAERLDPAAARRSCARAHATSGPRFSTTAMDSAGRWIAPPWQQAFGSDATIS